MWQLIINGPGYFDTTYDLPEGETSLGRADENDIVLSGDLVSRKHARIRVRGDALTVEDLGSRNGSRVNGQPLTGTSDLQAGDSVTVGENTLAIRQPAKVENAATEMVNLGAGGVKRFGGGDDIGPAVVISKNVSESVVLRALDNFSPLEPLPLSEGPTQELPPLSLEPASASPPVAYGSLVMLYKTAESLSRAKSLQTFLDDTTDRLMERVDATTAVVLLRHHSGVMVPAAVRHRGKLAKGEVPVSDAIIESALETGKAMVVGDVRDDSRFNARESVLMYGVDQVLCIPIGEGQPFAGVLYINKTAGDLSSLEQLLDLCTAVAHLIGTGMDKFSVTDRGRDEEKVRRTLERFHPPEVLERRVAELAQAGTGLQTQLEEKNVSVLVADLAGFSTICQNAKPAEVLELLNEFYQRMTGVIFSFEGTVDKFVGDSVMAVFGAPYTRGDDALRAVRTAMAMRADWTKAMKRRPGSLRCDLRIGINTGKVLAGAVGSETRMDYTAVGEPVNIASWLSASALPGQLLITGKTLAAIGARFDVTPLGERVLRAGKDKTAVFEVLEEDVGGAFTNPGMK